jgi:hypothetical protein
VPHPDSEYLADALRELRRLKKLAERAIEQVSDDELFRQIDLEANSIATIVKHMSGNMRSRFTDFLTADGEKPDRNRDAEFVIEPGTTRENVLVAWESGWHGVLRTLEPLAADDLGRDVFIRGERHSVLQAINRQVVHYAYHIGQIVLLAKHFRSTAWKSLSIPRGQSEQFNQVTGAHREGRER